MKNKIKKIYIKYSEIINYIIIGGMTTFISLATYYICTTVFLNSSNPIELQIANIISWIISVAFAYVTNRIFVFKSKNKNIVKECVSFCSSRIATLLIDMLLMFLLVSVLGLNDKIIKVLDQIIVIVLNYIISKFFVFKKNKSGADKND